MTTKPRHSPSVRALVDQERLLSSSREKDALSNCSVDQKSIRCPICGRPVPYDRSSDELQEITCSEECRALLEARFGYRSTLQLLRKRAADPDVCLICGTSLQGGSRRDALYCSDACKTRAFRSGISPSIRNTLVRIRIEAAKARKDVCARYKEVNVKT